MRRRTDDEDGVMLVELLVAMVLMSIVGVMVLNAIVAGFKGQRQLQDRGQALSESRTAVQRVTRLIREGTVVYATGTKLRMQQDDGSGGTVTHTWELVTTAGVTSLTQTTESVTAAGVAGPTIPVATVISNLDPATITFDYNSIPGWVAPAGSTADPQTCVESGSIPVQSEQDCIGTVNLHLARLVQGHSSVLIDATTDLRNAG